MTVEDVVQAMSQRLCDHQRANGPGADIGLVELRVALGVTEAQLMEAVGIVRASSGDLRLAFTTPTKDRLTLGPSWQGRCEESVREP